MKSFLGITNQKQGIIFFVFVIIVFLVTMDPFHWIKPAPAAPHAKMDSQKLGKATAAFLSDAKSAQSVLLNLFDRHPIVLVGEHNLIREEVNFIASTLPALQRRGVNLFAIEFLLASDQGEIDRLMAMPVFDEKLASDLMFRRLPLWGYQEYLNLLKSAWELNAKRSVGQAPFRVLGLGITQDFSFIKSQLDFQKPEIMRRIWASGIPDDQMAAKVFETLGFVLNQPIDDMAAWREKLPKMLVYVQRMSAATHWEDENYRDDMKKYGFEDKHRMGMILHEYLGDAVSTLMFYSPVPFQRSPIGVTYPDDGLINSVLEKLGAGKTPAMPVGIDLTSSVFGKVDCSQTDLGLWASSHHKPIPVMKDLADAIVVFGPIRKLHMVQAIPEFINAGNLQEAYNLLPASVNHGQTGATQLNDSIAKLVVDYRKVLDSFK